MEVILQQCHSFIYGGHGGVDKTAHKVLKSGFCWPTIFKDAQELVESGNVSKSPWCEWGIDFMGSVPSSQGNSYIPVAVEDVSEWTKTIATPTYDAKFVIKLFKN